MKDYDILIVGAGMVGLTCAALLAQQDFKVAVIDKNPIEFDNNLSEYDLRVSAITPASANIFKHLNIWQAITDNRISHFRKMQIWDNCEEMIFDCADLGKRALGAIVENKLIQACLYEKLRQDKSVDFYPQSDLQDLLFEKETVSIKFSDDNCLSGKLLLGADGAKSWVREKAQIEMTHWDYGHQAIIAQIQTSLPHEHSARQKFLKTGPLAFLPLQDAHQCSIVWSCPPDLAQAHLALEPTEFESVLAKAFDHKLGELKLCSKRAAFPLQMRHAQTYVKNRLALLGDAAHVIHPLAGQGVNLGFMDAACLVQTLVDARAKNRDFADFSTLRIYERQRRYHTGQMITFIEAVKQAFSYDHPLVENGLSWGLKFVNRTSLIKKHFMRQATGMAQLPELYNTFYQEE